MTVRTGCINESYRKLRGGTSFYRMRMRLKKNDPAESTRYSIIDIVLGRELRSSSRIFHYWIPFHGRVNECFPVIPSESTRFAGKKVWPGVAWEAPSHVWAVNKAADGAEWKWYRGIIDRRSFGRICRGQEGYAGRAKNKTMFVFLS